MTSGHEPTPEFESFLEWQIRSESRRAGRFGRPTRGGRGRLAGTVALIVFSVLLGAGGTVAADRVQESRRRTLHLKGARLRLELAESTARECAGQLAEIERSHRVGIVASREVDDARRRLWDAEAEVRVLRIDLEEVLLTGQAPNRALSAPGSGKRDPVADRLRIRLERAERHLDAEKKDLVRQEAMYEQGVLHSSDLSKSRDTVARFESEVEGLRRRIDLREKFLRGEITGDDVEREGLLADRRVALDLLRRSLESMRTEEARITKLYEAGAATSAELRRAQAAVRGIEGKVRLAEIQVKLLDRD